jgi:hypothetical protein
MAVRRTGGSLCFCFCVSLPTRMPTLLQHMASLAFALALVASPSVLGFIPQGNVNVRLSNKNKQPLIVAHALFRSARECADNRRSFSLFDRWSGTTQVLGSKLVRGYPLERHGRLAENPLLYCQVIRAHLRLYLDPPISSSRTMASMCYPWPT